MLQATKKLFKSVKGFIIIALLLMISSLAGCHILGSDGGRGPALKIETDKDVYDLDQDEYIAVQIENRSEQTIYYSTCLARELEILDMGELTDTITFDVCECICPATLEPGEQVDPDVSKLSIAILEDKSDQLSSGETISYRLKYSLYKDKAWGDEPLADHELRSNEFDLILPDD